MSAVSDKIKNLIKTVIDFPKVEIGKKLDTIVKNVRLGKKEGKNIDKLIKQIKDIEDKIELVQNSVKTINSVLKSLEASKKAAQASEKAATIGAALNPAAAAITVAQKIIIDKVETEIKQAKDAVNVVPSLIQNFETFSKETKTKLQKVQKEQETKDALKEQREIKLNS